MILILSNDGDLSTDIVIDWLRHYNQSFLRINTSDLLNKNFALQVIGNKAEPLKLNSSVFNVSDIGAVWYRKFGFFRKTHQARVIEELTNAYTLAHLSTEFSRVMDSLCYLFRDKYWLTNPKNIILTKTVVLEIAEQVGFKVPKTFIVNSKAELRDVCSKMDVITKSIYDPMAISVGNDKYTMFTKNITPKDIDNLPSFFLPSMVQETISKKIEIRTFYLEGKCFSMAIFSQSDIQTQVDFRKYNMTKPNRFVPYKLNDDIEEKIDRLMVEVGLNTGSLDFILTDKDELVFLEINPTGQFGMVDYSCNYGLHRKVANLLIKNDEKYCRM